MESPTPYNIRLRSRKNGKNGVIEEKNRNGVIQIITPPKLWGLRLVIYAMALLILILISYYLMHSIKDEMNTMYTHPHKVVPKATEGKPMKRILFWNSGFTHYHFNFGVGRKPFIKAGCGETHCHTVARRDTRTPVENFDAIIFHGWNFKKDDLPEKRSPHQRYILYITESPVLFPNNLGDVPPGFFNWTLTHRLDSDILGTYGYFKSLTDPEQTIMPPSENWHEFPIDFKESDLPERTRAKIENKTKLVAWFVSHCSSPGKREDYVNELKKYIPVDVYGQCGTSKCYAHEKEECFNKLEDEYKFYLSFENSICQDYVTEKFFDIMKYDVVPIVFGGGNYSLMAPPGSYIDVKDFNQPFLLAQYLLDLQAYPEDYAKHFWWKSYYEVEATNTHHFCQLCALLHNDDAPPKIYNNIHDWFVPNGTCQTITAYTNGVFVYYNF